MTLDEFAQILKSTGYPVAYRAFPETQAPDMPFIVYQETGSDNFGADNRVYHSSFRVQVDFLSRLKDRSGEERIEQAFDSNDIFWERVMDFENTEDFYRTTYEAEI